MPPPKEHFFNVRTPPGTSVDEVIDALEALIGTPEIYSVQHFGGLDFQVGVNSLRAVQVLLDCGGLRLGTHVSQLIPVARQVASVTCLYLPSFVPDNEVVNSLKSFGTTLKIEEARYKDRPTIRTGTRHIRMDMRSDNPLPNFARVSGHRATFEYRGVRRLCRRCNLEGHIRAQCDTPYCVRCGVFGHRTDTCTAACRRCGGAHASVDCTARKSYSMAAAMEVDEFPILGRTPATEQTRLTTLRRAKRPMPQDTGDEREAGGIPAKAAVQAAPSETLRAKGEANEISEERAASMRSIEEPSHATQATHTQATAAAAADAGRSAKDEHGLRHTGASGGEWDEDAASGTSWATVDETMAEGSRFERSRSDSTGVRTVAAEGPPGGSTLSLEEKPTQEGGGEIPQSWWDKKGEDETGSCRSLQPSRSGQSTGSAEPENIKTLGDEDALQSATSSHTPKPAPQHGGASQQSGREGDQHGDRKGGSARQLARSDGKPAATAIRPGNCRNSGHETTGISSSEEQEPGKLVIDEHAPTPPGSPKRNPQSTTPTPTGVGRGRHSRNRDTDTVPGGNRTATLGPSGSSTDRRPQRITKVARRETAARLRGRTPSSGREEATTTQRPSKATAAHDMDSDSDFY